MRRAFLAFVVLLGGVTLYGCSGSDTGITKPDKPVPPPDPSMRLETGSGGPSSSGNKGQKTLGQ